MADLRRIRRVKTEAFTTINNAILRDDGISLKAKAVLITVMGLPEDWDFSIKGLEAIVKEGREAIYSAIRELRDAGYVRLDEIREKGRIVSYEYVFSEQKWESEPHTGFPYTVKPETDKPYTENPTQYKKQEIKETKNKRKRECTRPPGTRNQESEVASIFRERFDFPLPSSLLNTIVPAVENLDAWRRTVDFWRGNDYGPSLKMLEYYHEELAVDPKQAHIDAFRNY